MKGRKSILALNKGHQRGKIVIDIHDLIEAH